jgi:hypothetical protein
MRESTHDNPYDSRFDPAFQPGFDEGAATLPDYDGIDVLLGGGTDDPGEPRRPPRAARPLVDRFVVLLWVVGAGLVVLGIAMVFTLSTNDPSSDFTQNYMMILMLSQLSPWLVLAGLATLIGTVFLLATRWERRT